MAEMIFNKRSSQLELNLRKFIIFQKKDFATNSLISLVEVPHYFSFLHRFKIFVHSWLK